MTNTSERNGQKVYEYHEYERDGNNFSLRGSGDASQSIRQKVTVKDVAYDTNGTAYYYVNGLTDFGDDGTPYDNDYIWIPASETDNPANTLIITSTQSFNVQARDVSKNYDFYTLQSNGTLKWGGNVPARLWYYESQQYYPWIYTVEKTAKDKNGVVYYCLKEDESYFKETWVKASEFEATNKANNVDSNVRFQWTAKENSDLGQRELAIINKLRSEVGSQALYLDSSHQAEVNQRAQNRLQYYIQNGTVNHDGAFSDAAENILAYKIEGVQPTTQAVQDGNIRLLTNYWNAEKAMYEKGGYSYEDYGHYYNLINSAYHSVTVGSATTTVNGKRYVVVVEEYWK